MALVGWWPLDGNTDDYSVNNNTGVNTNITFVNGKIGQAATFAVGSLIQANGGIAGIFSKQIFSWGAWIRMTGFSYRILMSATNRIELNIASNRLNISINGSDGWSSLTGTTTLSQNVWYHVFATYGNGVAKIYVNGIQEGFLNKANFGTTGDNLLIGNWSSLTQSFVGNINDVRVYDHVLSQKEINELAKAKVLQYTFNKDDGSIVYDGSGLKRNGTVNGATWINKEYYFDRVDDAIYTAPFLMDNSFTFSCKLKLESLSGTYQGIFWSEVNSNSVLSFLFSYIDGYFHYRINNAVTGWTNTNTAQINVNMLNYNRIVWTFNNGTTKIYLNGNLFHQDTSRGSYIGLKEAIYFGNRNDYVYDLHGYMDDIVVYNTALSDANILDMYQTRAKIDNQGNLYANEFVEDYEVKSNLTLTQLFNNNNIIVNSSFELDSNSDGLANSWGTENTSNYQLVGNFTKSQKVSSGTVHSTFRLIQSLSTLPITNNIYYYNMNIKERVNISGSQFQISSTSPSYVSYYGPNTTAGFNSFRSTFPTFDRNNARIQINFDFNGALYLNGLAYIVIDDVTMINLTAVFGAGNEPTQAQMDAWYKDFIQSRTKSNGQVVSKEFSEVDSPSQEMKIFKDKIHIQGSLNEGGQ